MIQNITKCATVQYIIFDTLGFLNYYQRLIITKDEVSDQTMIKPVILMTQSCLTASHMHAGLALHW